MTMNVNAIRVAGCLGSGGTPRTWPTSSGRWLSRCCRRRGLAAARRSIHAGPLWTGSCTSCGLAAPAGTWRYLPADFPPWPTGHDPLGRDHHHDQPHRPRRTATRQQRWHWPDESWPRLNHAL